MMVLVMVWDGFLIIGEGLGLQRRAARHFADACWITSATLTTAYLTLLGLVVIR